MQKKNRQEKKKISKEREIARDHQVHDFFYSDPTFWLQEPALGYHKKLLVLQPTLTS